MSEFDTEWRPGLPEKLPEGEIILWQGRPRWWPLARRSLHARKVGIYFLLVGLWMGADALAGGASALAAAGQSVSQLAIGILAVGVLGLLAWLMSRSTVYTITDRRIVARFGVALPITVNLPFARIAGADLKRYRDGTGDIALSLTANDRISYLLFWPHVRPWHYARPQPALRVVPEVDRVAELLADALAASQGRGGAPVAETPSEEPVRPPVIMAG